MRNNKDFMEDNKGTLNDNKEILRDNIEVTQKASVYRVRVAAVSESKANKVLNVPTNEIYEFDYMSLKGEVPSEKECLTRFHKVSLKSGAFRVVGIRLEGEQFVPIEHLKGVREG